MITLTGTASTKVKAIMEQEQKSDWNLRMGVRGGGCSGMMYEMDWVAAPNDGDKLFELDDVKVCVDKKSYLFLNGIELDFEDTLVRSGFVFHNPAAKRSCSCGESFTV